jgi:tetratricopeptide (TPR) repeat protein
MKLKDVDPVLYNTSPVSILTLFDLNKKSELFYLAHQLADTNPKRPESWFAVGCYYLLIRKTSVAQSYFEKSTSVDPHFAPAWIGYGNAFAAQDESDQAMAAYRTFKKEYHTVCSLNSNTPTSNRYSIQTVSRMSRSLALYRHGVSSNEQ